MDFDTVQKTNSNKISFQFVVRRNRSCRTGFLHVAKIEACTSLHGGVSVHLCCFKSKHGN